MPSGSHIVRYEGSQGRVLHLISNISSVVGTVHLREGERGWRGGERMEREREKEVMLNYSVIQFSPHTAK